MPDFFGRERLATLGVTTIKRREPRELSHDFRRQHERCDRLSRTSLCRRDSVGRDLAICSYFLSSPCLHNSEARIVAGILLAAPRFVQRPFRPAMTPQFDPAIPTSPLGLHNRHASSNRIRRRHRVVPGRPCGDRRPSRSPYSRHSRPRGYTASSEPIGNVATLQGEATVTRDKASTPLISRMTSTRMTFCRHRPTPRSASPSTTRPRSISMPTQVSRSTITSMTTAPVQKMPRCSGWRSARSPSPPVRSQKPAT